jgi:glycosyltransferase involved in cell wall biosynthesis
MKVLISALGVTMGGALRHLRGFVPALAAEPPGHSYTLLARKSIAAQLEAGNVRLEPIDDAVSSGVFSRLWYDNVVLPKVLREGRYDALVSLVNFGPIYPGVIHLLFQRNALFFNSIPSARTWHRKSLDPRLRRFLAIQAMRRANVIVTPSRAMADMIRTSVPWTGHKIFSVLHHGFDFEPAGPSTSFCHPDMTDRSGLRLLYPSHPGRHKGFEVLLQAIAILRSRGATLKLFLTTSPTDQSALSSTYEDAARKLGIGDFVVFLGSIPQERMPQIYASADLLVYPSLVESFGFALLEGMAHRLPIVAADTPVNRELCQDAAVYYSATDATAAANAVERVFSIETRAELVNSCETRLATFDWSWRRYVREFVRVLDQVQESVAREALPRRSVKAN